MLRLGHIVFTLSDGLWISNIFTIIYNQQSGSLGRTEHTTPDSKTESAILHDLQA